MYTRIWRDTRVRTTNKPCERVTYASPESVACFSRYADALLTDIREKRESCQHEATHLDVQLADDQAGIHEDSAERRCSDCGRLLGWGEEAL